MTEQKIEPATDEEMADYMTGREIAIFRREQDGYMHCVECDASPVGGMRSGHRSQCGNRAWPKIKARIEADRETITALEALNAEMLEALKGLYHSPASFTDERMDYDERQVSKADYATAGAVVAKAEKGIA